MYIYIIFFFPLNQRLGRTCDYVEEPQMIMVWCLGFVEAFGIAGCLLSLSLSLKVCERKLVGCPKRAEQVRGWRAELRRGE